MNSEQELNDNLDAVADAIKGFRNMTPLERRIEKAQMTVDSLGERYYSLDSQTKKAKWRYDQAIKALEELTEQQP